MTVVVGAVGQGDVWPRLVEGLKRLQHRPHDAAGIVVLDRGNALDARCCAGPLDQFERELLTAPPRGALGIGHLRDGLRGGHAAGAACLQVSHGSVAVAHNGVIANQQTLRAALQSRGYPFSSDTDVEVIAHLVHEALAATSDLFEAVRRSVRELAGQFSIAVTSTQAPACIVVARQGRPMLVGVSDEGEQLVATEVPALLPSTARFIVLEDGDVAQVQCDDVSIVGANDRLAVRPLQRFGLDRVAYQPRRRAARRREEHVVARGE